MFETVLYYYSISLNNYESTFLDIKYYIFRNKFWTASHKISEFIINKGQ